MISEENKIEIKVNETPYIILLILTLLAITCGLIPIAVTAVIVYTKAKLNLVTIAGTYGIMGFAAYRLYRMILWNIYGKELIYIKDNQIIYLADFKRFQDGKQSIALDNIECFTLVDDESQNEARLMFTNGIDEIQTVIKKPISEINSLKSRIETSISSLTKPSLHTDESVLL